ncbi:MAG: ParB N-terminal domain-containing protein, partial [Oscillospiraceae bacterium]|nr:ParB N-terminal domain-containing protein [Oscillospiraceae bacterium]
WDYFDKPDKLELLNLMSSIELIGIVTPLLVKTKDYEVFTIISGNSRFQALKNIFKFKKEEKFRKVPCFVLDEPIDEYFERSLIIDVNLNYRKISQEVYTKSILEKYALIQRTKKYKNEINIAETIANQMSISDSTVFNYLTLKKLCNEAMTLVNEKKLKLGPARMLARLSHENQLYILENTKLEDVNAVHKLKVLIENPKASIYEIEKKVNFIQDFVPQNTDVTITVNKDALKELFNNIIDFKEFINANFSGKVTEKKLENMVKVKVNREHMKFYIQNNFLDGSLIEKVTGKNLNEILAV